MLAVRVKDPSQNPELANLATSDPEYRYFRYRYVYELARLLNCHPQRIVVASLSPGSVLVNTVFTTVGGEDARAQTQERHPMGLITLLQALQTDQSSQMYTSRFFKY